MERIREYMMRWTGGRAAAEIALLTAGAIVIAVVPGALMFWLAWRFLRQRIPAYPRP